MLEQILNGGVPTDECVCFMGNHEEAMLECLDGSEASYAKWLQQGGLQTMESYGLTRQDLFNKSFDLARSMRVLIPFNPRSLYSLVQELRDSGRLPIRTRGDQARHSNPSTIHARFALDTLRFPWA